MYPSKAFFQVKTVETTLQSLYEHVQPLDKKEIVSSYTSLGRILAENLHSPMDLPSFVRSTMDGFAVRAADTFGASESLPAYLKLVAHISMGTVPDVIIGKGEAAEIHTGAMLPEGADAVVMLERCQIIAEAELEVLSPVAQGENLVQIGEDVRQHSPILAIGHRIRPQDIGALLAVGIQQIQVFRKPKVAILSSGDELLASGEVLEIGKIYDINSAILAAMLQELGAEAFTLGIAKDDFQSLYSMAKSGIDQADMLVMSAGSSVSARDLSYEVVNHLGKPGVLQHGLAVKPGKPTILAVCDSKPVIALPGNPVSAVLVARQIVLPILRYLMREEQPSQSYVEAVLQENLASTTGREDSIALGLVKEGETYLAYPILGKSNLIYTLLRADGLVHIPLDVSGYKAGTIVKVSLF